MELATVTSKGQITIPVSIRKFLEIDKGDKILLEERNGSVYMVNASKSLNFDKLLFSSKTVTTEDAIEDVVPFEWDDEVLNGEKKVIL